MKPTLPEEGELEQMSAEVSARYRAHAHDEPPARLDALVLAAARGAVKQPRPGRNWQMPASMAAMLVMGVSLVLLVREHEPPLPSLERPALEEKLAKPASPEWAMKKKPAPAGADFYREAPPSRERQARRTRETVMQDRVAAAPVIAERVESATQEQSSIAESKELAQSKKSEALADGVSQSRVDAQAPLEKEAGRPALPREWLAKINALQRDGRQAEARAQLLEFRKQYPHYRLPETLQILLPLDQR